MDLRLCRNVWISAAPDGNLYDVSCQHGNRKTGFHTQTGKEKIYNRVRPRSDLGVKPERPKYLFRVSDTIQTKPQMPEQEDKTEQTPKMTGKGIGNNIKTKVRSILSTSDDISKTYESRTYPE